MIGATLVFLTASFAFLTTYLAGWVVSAPILNNLVLPSPITFFVKLALGYLFVITAFSLYYTGGFTIMSGILLLILATAFLNRRDWRLPSKLPSVEGGLLLSGLVVLALLFFFQCWRYGYFDEQYFHVTMQDNGIYATVAEYLKITGVETSSPWYQLVEVSADKLPKVYHFEDFWYLAFVLEFLPEKPLDVYNFTFTPVLGLIAFSGFNAVAISLCTKPKSVWWLMLPAFCCVLFSMIIPGLGWSVDLHSNVMKFPKIAAFPILLSLILVARHFNLKYLDALAFGAMIIADPILFPTILGTSVLLYSTLVWMNRSREDAICLILILFSVTFFFLFHQTVGSLVNSSQSNYMRGEESYFYSFAKNLTASHLRSFIFFFPGYLSALFLFQSRGSLSRYEQEAIALPIILISTAAFSRAFLSNNFEGFQFDILMQTPAAAFLLLGCLIILWQKTEEAPRTKLARKMLFLLVSAQLSYGVFSTVQSSFPKRLHVEKAFVWQVKEALKNRTKIGASIVNLETADSFTSDPRMCLFCNFLKHIGSGYWANQINLPASLEEVKFKERTNATELAPFFRFIQKLKKENRYTSYEDAQTQFIQTYNVDYVVVEKGANLPVQIEYCVEATFTDTLSWTRVLILNRFCREMKRLPEGLPPR